MEGLIRFDDLKPAANGTPESTAGSENFPSAAIIEQLRNRLIGPDYRDPIEIKSAILGDLVYFCYREITKRRVL